MLRGINVGGHEKVPMKQLRAMFEALGFDQVRTFIQSGNVVFNAAKISPLNLSKRIEARILEEFGFAVSVLTKTSEEMGKAIQANPFLREKGIDTTKLHVSFLAEAPAVAGLKKLESLDAGCDQFRASGHEIYLYCPGGYGQTKLANNALEKMLSVSATTRNWNTVNKLYEMSCQTS